VLDPAETAIRQIEARGFTATDVRHILVTHFDLDHIGGLADFPDATVHVSAAEADGAIHHPSWRERVRYSRAQWARPEAGRAPVTGDAWRGFAAAEQLTDIDPGLVFVSLPGHTRGHAAVAVDTGSGWIPHAGDAFYHHSAIDGRGRQPWPLTLRERAVAWHDRTARHNRARLAEL
jgi:glyoxylase-like metal-dependent hydrolase (beta-lactamase superfamily II)